MLMNAVRAVTSLFSRESGVPPKTGKSDFEDEYTPYEEHYRLAYELSLKALDHQTETLDGIHQRASHLLAASSIVTGFLGSAALPSATKPALGVPGWSAVLLFGLTVAILLDVIRPRTGWGFTVSGRQMVEGYVRKDPTASLAQTYYGLAAEMDDAVKANQPRLDRLLDGLEGAIIFTGLSIVAWIVELLQ